MRRLALAALGIAALTGCGGDGDGPSTAAPPVERGERQRPADERPVRPPAPRCPPEAANCAAAAGRVIALESLDPDGDGDLHVVIAGGGVTLPGVSVLDVSAALRPPRDPRVGDWAAGAGPVYEGSFGQRQIEVVEVAFAPRRGG